MSEAEDPLNVRLTKEITALSTNLVTAVAKQSELEEVILQYRKENSQLKANLNECSEYKVKYEKLFPECENWKKNYQESNKLKVEAEARVSKLEAEVEDLTATLFDEANTMVSNASRETYNFKVKNGKLQEEIEEKNTIIENLQEQLKDLKQLFFDLEIQQKINRESEKQENLKKEGNLAIINSLDHSHESERYHLRQLNEIIYSPRIKSIRFDREEFHEEFKPFICSIIKPTFTFDLTSLKTTKFFKRIWVEEIENSFPVIPASAKLFGRWQKGKLFWNFIVEGKAVIEPISGVNETFKLSYKKTKSGEDPPIATKEPCNFCGEQKDDILEYSRLYCLRFLNPDYDPNASSADRANSNVNITDEFLASHPLCNHCLVKLRNVCAFFAQLRLIHSNVFKLNVNTSVGSDTNTSPTLVQTTRFNRLFNENTHLNTIDKSKPYKVEDIDEESKIMKLYISIIKLRAKIFWSKIGYWDNVKDIEEVNLDDINYEVFQGLLRPEIATNEKKEEKDVEDKSNLTIAKTTSLEDEDVQIVDVIEPNNPPSPKKTDSVSSTKASNSKSSTRKSKNRSKSNSSKKSAISEAELQKQIDETIVIESSDDEFADATNEDNNSNAPKRKSSTKEFKKKIDSDLNSTLSMLEESIKADS